MKSKREFMVVLLNESQQMGFFGPVNQEVADSMP